MKSYAIADLHGRFDLLEAALAEIEAREPGRVIFLGDYVDRGPQSRQIIERLMAGPPKGWRWVCLKGNHEDMMVSVLRGEDPMPWWLQNGGGATLISYGQKVGERADPSVVPVKHVHWLDRLPLKRVDTHRVFVHAGVDATIPLDEQMEKTQLWKRYPRLYQEGHGERHVVHGHEQYENGPVLLSGRTDLDTFAWYTGRLVVGVFDDDVPGGPIELIEVHRAPAFEAVAA